MAAGEQHLAEVKSRELTALLGLIRKPALAPPGAFGFNEWCRAQDGHPRGADWQTWSASMYLYAAACVEKGKALFFE